MAIVRCPACGTENPAGTTYCSTCARRLDQETSERLERQRATALATQGRAIQWTMVLAVGVAIVVIAIVALVIVLSIR